MSKTLWAVIIVIVVVAAGWFIYYKSTDTGVAPATTAVTDTTTPNNGAIINTVYDTSTNSTKGSYLTTVSGMTLYTYSSDTTPGASSCTGACAVAWPPYTAGATPQSALPANITLISRADGSMQYAYNGKPLYYYKLDLAPGQINGDGVGGFSIVKM